MTRKVQSYAPKMVPSTGDEKVDALGYYVQHELETISRALSSFTFLQLEVLYDAPDKPRDGMIVEADGTHWNPGFGAGPYAYYSGAWHKLFP